LDERIVCITVSVLSSLDFRIIVIHDETEQKESEKRYLKNSSASSFFENVFWPKNLAKGEMNL